VVREADTGLGHERLPKLLQVSGDVAGGSVRGTWPSRTPGATRRSLEPRDDRSSKPGSGIVHIFNEDVNDATPGLEELITALSTYYLKQKVAFMTIIITEALVTRFGGSTLSRGRAKEGKARARGAEA